MVLRLTLFEGTRWQDGQPLTAEDVEYTLKLGKKYTLNFSPWWNYVLDVRAVDDRTVDIILDPEKPHRTLVMQDLGNIYILPSISGNLSKPVMAPYKMTPTSNRSVPAISCTITIRSRLPSSGMIIIGAFRTSAHLPPSTSPIPSSEQRRRQPGI